MFQRYIRRRLGRILIFLILLSGLLAIFLQLSKREGSRDEIPGLIEKLQLAVGNDRWMDMDKTASEKLQAEKNSNNSGNILEKPAMDWEDDGFPEPCYDVHAFYYIWYANPAHDGQYMHWNHPFIPHWNKRTAEHYPTGSHRPPDDIGSNFYPALGLYSSQDTSIIEQHMHQLRQAKIGVISVSWYPPNMADENGLSIDFIITPLMNMAAKYKIKVCFHIEPYKGRNAATLTKYLRYVINLYGAHPAFYRRRHKNKNLPIYYIYDSYNIGREEWARIFTLGGDLSVRSTELDGIFIGLLTESKHRQDLTFSGFDGFYTYFASQGFTYGSSPANWNNLARETAARGQLFIPSIGPGYIDDRIRPWNKANTKDREDGQYYERFFKKAIDLSPPIITITSFNEWGEGTQIETVIPKDTPEYKYLDYSPHESDYYLQLTCKWVDIFRRKQ